MKKIKNDPSTNNKGYNRRFFIKSAGIGIGAGILGCKGSVVAQQVIQGFEDTGNKLTSPKIWTPFSDRKLRVGLVGYGVCQFAAAFGFQDHPNVEVVAVSDLFPDRCAKLAEVTKCNKTYPSLEELVKDSSIEAVFVATDAPSHARHCLDVLNHGKHCASAVPAIWGSDQLEDAEKLFETVKRTGLKYMMFETSAFHDGLYAMREIYKAGGFGKLIYSEGEYYHYMPEPLPSYKDWRVGLPPQWYSTHANAYYICVNNGSFTEVSCIGHRSSIEQFQPENNVYRNPFGSATALYKTSEGGMARMNIFWDNAGIGAEAGRISGEKGSFWNTRSGFSGLPESMELVKTLNLKKPPLPPGVEPGYHEGSHGPLCHEFIMSILENRKPYVNIAMALNISVAGVIAHQSALNDGELMKIPQYKYWD